MVTRLQLALGLLVDQEQLDLYRDRTPFLPTHENIRKWNNKIRGDVSDCFRLQQKWFLEQLRYAQVAMSIFFLRFVLRSSDRVFFHETFNLHNQVKWCSDGAEANMIWTARPILADQEKYLQILRAFDHFTLRYREQFAQIETEIEEWLSDLRALAELDVQTRLDALLDDSDLSKELSSFSVWLHNVLIGISPHELDMQELEREFKVPLLGYSPQDISGYIRNYEIQDRSVVP